MHIVFVQFVIRYISCKCNKDSANILTGLNNNEQTKRIPRMVKAMATRVVVQIACGKEHSIALTNDGELYAWGSNKEGQLGISEDMSIERKPTIISSLAAVPIAFIACGGYHTVVISKSGKSLETLFIHKQLDTYIVRLYANTEFCFCCFFEQDLCLPGGGMSSGN